MKIETLHDVMQWTKKMHQRLHDFSAHCALERDNERISLLLDHISEHEQNMALVIKEFTDNGQSSVLNTYCRQYYEKRAVRINTECEQLFAKMDMDEIAAAILEYHKHIIGLFEYLQNCSSAPSVAEFLSKVLSFEEAEERLLARNMKQIRDGNEL